MNLEEKLFEWREQYIILKAAKKAEMKLRKDICEEIFNGRKGKFTEKVTVGDFDITAESKTTLSLDEEMLDDMEILSVEEEACIKRKPSLVASGLKELDEDSALWDCISEKPATPTLKIKEI